VFQGLVARWLQPRVLGVIESVGAAAHDLDLVVGMLRAVERERFASPYLQAVQRTVRTGGRTASAEIRSLEQFVAMLDSRTNIFTAVPAALMLWATQWAFAIEAWRTRTGAQVPQWLDAIGELEALLALASFSAEHPDYVFPEIVDGPAMLRAASMAHPILPPGAVANDLHLDTRGTALLVVSGSNMSGKSTLLRTIGVSVVLAEAGAPVRASSFVCTPLALGASIHVEDSLTDGRSRFLAEITRLKQVVDLAHAQEGALLFLFDEILSGTNSHDRRVGAEALVSGLVAAGAIGLVTTHDLALGDIVDRLGNRAENVHFVDHFEDGVLRFDYQLRPGIVRTSNAIALMKAVGLNI
jgi:DNA mismatch repair ATPase MutS